MHRRASYAALGAALSFGAPLGLCLLPAARAKAISLAWLHGEIVRDPSTYAYIAVSTRLAFTL